MACKYSQSTVLAHRSCLFQKSLPMLAGRLSFISIFTLVSVVGLLAAYATEISAAASSEVTKQPQNLTITKTGTSPVPKTSSTTTSKPAERLGASGGAAGERITVLELPVESAASSAHQPTTTPAPRYNYRLPTWFNFSLFKQLHGKRYKTQAINELHKRIYLQTALKVLEQRALFRMGRVSSLATLNELSDLTSEQLAALRGRTNQLMVAPTNARLATSSGGNKTAQLPECCSYDQVYERVIELLNSTVANNSRFDVVDVEQISGGGGGGGNLSVSTFARALIDELEQRPLIQDQEKDEKKEDEHSVASIGQAEPRSWTMVTSVPNVEQPANVQVKPSTIDRQEILNGHQSLGDSLVRAASGAPSLLPVPKAPPADGLQSEVRQIPKSSVSAASASTPPITSTTTQAPDADMHELIRSQLAAQWSEQTPVGRQLVKKFSEYFGQPVRIRVRVDKLDDRSPTAKP